MTIDDVPADTLMILTLDLERLFKFAGCNPTCHVCNRTIPVGSRFQLISYRGSDVMTCNRKTCDRNGLEGKHKQKLGAGYSWKETEEQTGEGYYYPTPHKGFSRPSKTLGVK